MFILDELSAVSMASRMTDQAPPGWGEGLVLLMYAAIVLTVAPTVLAATIGGVAGWLMHIGAGNGFWIGIGSGVIGTVLAWGVVGIAFILLNFDIDPDPNVWFFFIFVSLGAGVVAPVCIAILVGWKSRRI